MRNFYPSRLLSRLGVVAACGLALGAGVGLSGGHSAGAVSGSSPYLQVGPRVTLSDARTADQALFTCQLVNSPLVCYDPNQIRRAYHITPLLSAGYDGTGRTIVIVDAFQSPWLNDDLAAFDTRFNLPPASNFLTVVAPQGLTPFNPNDSNMISWSGEITLDVSWAHAVAPGAKIVLDLARSNQDSDLNAATKYAVDNHLGDVISQSFGENESCASLSNVQQLHQIYEEATLKKITLIASSGDEGAAQQTCDGNSWTQAASWPADDPLVTAVGGTELHAAGYCLPAKGCNPTQNPAPGTYEGEIALNEAGLGPAGGDFSTGGGFSTLFYEPFYQKSVVSGNSRAVPDVAYDAAIFHGVLVHWLGNSGGWFLFGGTSSGSPQWAGIVAIADQKANRDLGFINPALYQIASKYPTRYAQDFNDITVGTNAVTEYDAKLNAVNVPGFNAGKGWDATTGLGSPVVSNIVDDINEFDYPSDSTGATLGTSPHSNGHESTVDGQAKPH